MNLNSISTILFIAETVFPCDSIEKNNVVTKFYHTRTFSSDTNGIDIHHNGPPCLFTVGALFFT